MRPPAPAGPGRAGADRVADGLRRFLLRRDGRVERLPERWFETHAGNPPQPHADGRRVGVNARGAVVVRRAGVRVWRATGTHHGISPVFGPGGALAFGAYGQGVYLTDLRSRERLVVRGRAVWPLAFGDDGNLVVRGAGALVVLRPDGTPLRRIPYRTALGALTDPVSGRVHVVAPDGTLTVVDGARVTRLARLAGVAGWLTSAAHGRFAFQEARRVRVWDARGRVVAQAGWPRSLAADSGLVVAPDGRAVAFRLSDAYPGAAFGTARVRVLDGATGRAREIYRHRLGPSGCGVGGNLVWRGRALLYDAYDGNVAVLDADGGPAVRLTRLARTLSPAGIAGGVAASWLASYRAVLEAELRRELLRQPHAAVAPGPRLRLRGQHEPAPHLRQQARDLVDAGALVALLQQPLLDLGPEAHAPREAVAQVRPDERGLRQVEVVGRLAEGAVRRERRVLRVEVGLAARVAQRVGDRRAVGADVEQLQQAHGLLALHEDVRAAVRHPLQHVRDARRARGVAHAGLVLQHDRERLVSLLTARHQVAVARLEDVQRQTLVGQ